MGEEDGDVGSLVRGWGDKLQAMTGRDPLPASLADAFQIFLYVGQRSLTLVISRIASPAGTRQESVELGFFHSLNENKFPPFPVSCSLLNCFHRLARASPFLQAIMLVQGCFELSTQHFRRR